MGKASLPSLATALCAALVELLRPARGHGYLASPRSRNLLAFQETVWWPQTESDPEPETCPHCLNRGGSRARCGLFESPGGSNGDRNYDAPKNALGGPMPPTVQATYVQGQNVVLDVTLTAHHKGHFVFSACPISPGEIPTQECFDRHQLTFVADLLHGANYDPNYPERAYIAPVNDPNYIPDLGSTRGIMDYSFNMLLPPDLHGDLVLIQWYYLTANSCYHEGYQDYDWPADWNIDATSSGKCGDVSPDGTGVPEQFWNCAEVRILQGAADDPASTGPAPTPAANVPANKPVPMEMSSGIAIPVGLPSQGVVDGARPSSAGSHGKTIVGYYASWQWYDRQKKAAPENMDFTKVQRVNFAFFQTDTQGNMWGTDAWADPNLLFGPYDWNPSPGAEQYCSWDSPTNKVCNYHHYEQGLIHLVHAAGAEIYPSLGGWTLSDAFPAMAADANARATFAQNCIKLIQEYGFDGIDIDWEYPGYEDHSGTPQDRDNYKLLLNDVRAKLDELGAQTGEFYGLTAALPCGPRHIENMDIAHVARTLSELNLMTYDFHGAFSETSGINAPMYYQGWGEEDFNVHSCVENWLAGGGSRDKINIGLPFYGRSVLGATGLNQPHSGADKSVWGIDDGTPQYFNIVAQLPSMTTVWDKKTWTPYAYFDNGGFVSFDDENSICVKVQYAIENRLGGFIIWELSGDLMDDLSTPLLDVTNKKLHNPGFNCGEPGIYPEQSGASVPAASVPVSVPSSGPVPAAPDILDQVPATANSSGGSATPGTFPTPSFPTNLNSVSSPESPKPTPGSATTGTLPTPSFPTISSPVPSPEILEPSGPAADDQPMNFQPVDLPMNDQPKFFLCGDQQGTFNLADSKALDLSFRYEVHRTPGVPVSDAIKELKNSMLTDVAETLNCVGASSVLRGLRNNQDGVNRESVMAIESTQSDLPEDDTPCSIPVNLGASTICRSVIGTMTAHFRKGTSLTVLSEVLNDLLFHLRTSMASGKYESANIRRVIYIEVLSANPVESNVAPLNTNVESETQSSEEGTNPSVAIAFILIVIILSAFTVFVFTRRKRRLEPRHADEHSIIMENKPEAPLAALPAHDSTEETWKKALDTEDVWRNAMSTYGERLPIESDEEEQASRGLDLSEPSVEPMIRDGSLFAREKKKSKKKKKRSVAPIKRASSEPDEEMRSSDSIVEDGQNHHFDTDREGNVDDGGSKALEPPDEKIEKEEECYQEHNETDDRSSLGRGSEGKEGSAVDDKNDEIDDKPPLETTEEESSFPPSDQNDRMVGNEANDARSPSSNMKQGTHTSGEGSNTIQEQSLDGKSQDGIS